ncbi:MAG: lipid-A-disaccharide synthase [Aquificaceae bacterium]|nr:MAG: lipid-A-disaccharide synthase [Aquificaceae bacterium]
MRIAIVVGEASGDILGSRLIEALRQHHPDLVFEGIAGSEMIAAGFEPLYPMEKLAVMGFTEVLPRLRELLNIRKDLVQRWQHNPPDIFIGIDAPDFNLKLEALLHQQNIPTVHYVSPSVWAWRESRVKKIKGNIDLMLTLFPFEVDFYKQHDIPAKFVGHPLADEIALHSDKQPIRKKLGLDPIAHILAVLPGSRTGEIKRLTPDFLQGLKRLHQKYPDWQFVIPFINTDIRKQFERLKQSIAPDVPIVFIAGQSRKTMAAADQILMASGTAVLEGMLINRPMVAAYRVSALTAFIIRRFKMIKTSYFTLANNLCDKPLVPELIQEDVTAENIMQAVEKQFLQSKQQRDDEKQCFHNVHLKLRQNASQQAAKAILDVINK